jgi:hypothetical protein
MDIRARRRYRVIAMAAGIALLLSACSVRVPFREDLETAIPAALLSSDLGIAEVYADNGVDGFAITISVVYTVDHSTVTPEELRKTLALIVNNVNLSKVTYVRVGAHDGSTPENTLIDIGKVGERLGFDPSTGLKGYLTADWDEIIAVLDATA